MPQVSAALRPLLLRPDNFTPAARTPWGGRRIVGEYKAALGLPHLLAEQRVGESWEVSFGPELPSYTHEDAALRDVCARDPASWLGAEAAHGASALLVKWLDAADELSVQIHPSVDDPGLLPGETGKPECWYIAASDPGAGIYLGLQPSADEARMRQVLAQGDDVSKLLRFRPVEPGDFFLLTPGLPHAIGRGVCLVEPQYVAPGKKGLTLRYWDWNRRYDEHGRLDPQGKARELHVERALAVTDWPRSSSDEYLAAQRTSTGPARLREAASGRLLCGPEPNAPVRSQHLRVMRYAGSGRTRLPEWPTLLAITVIEGALVLRGAFGELRVARGCSAALPAALCGIECELERGHALVSSVVV